MASRIAALQAKLGGGAMIMGGMRPGGAPPMRRKKARQRRASLDNSALLTRTTVKGDRKKKRATAINFDALEDEKTDDAFNESLAADIDMKKTKAVTSDNSKNTKANTSSAPHRGRMGMGMGMGMGAMLASAGALRKSKKKAKKAEDEKSEKYDRNLGPRRDRTTSRSFSKGVTAKPLIDLKQTEGYKLSKTPTPNKDKEGFPDVEKKASGLRCEIVKQDMSSKTVRLFASYEKYFEAKKGDNGKGLVVIHCIDPNFKAVGVGIGWKLSKLGKRNVSKTSFIMLRNQLMAQASTAKQHGYELTFSDVAAKQNHSSQPNSPNMASKEAKKGRHVAPGTAPFKPQPQPQPMHQLKMKSLSEKRREIEPKQAVTGLANEMNHDEVEEKRFKQKRNDKKCSLVEQIGANTKKIRLYDAYTKYFEAEGFNGTNKGFTVKNIANNEHGKALRALGINNGWNITHCANKQLGNRMFVMLKNQISATAKMVGKTGYVMQFQHGAQSAVSFQQKQKQQMPLSSPALHNKPYSAPPKKVQSTAVAQKTQPKQHNIGFTQKQKQQPQQMPYGQKKATTSPQRQQPQRQAPKQQMPYGQKKPQWQPPQRQAPQIQSGQRQQTQPKQQKSQWQAPLQSGLRQETQPIQRQNAPYGQNKAQWQSPQRQAPQIQSGQRQQVQQTAPKQQKPQWQAPLQSGSRQETQPIQRQNAPYGQNKAQWQSPQRQAPQMQSGQRQQTQPKQQKPQWQAPLQSGSRQETQPIQRQNAPYGQKKAQWQPPQKQTAPKQAPWQSPQKTLPQMQTVPKQEPNIKKAKSLPPKITPLATATKVSTTNTRNAYQSNKDAKKKDASEEKIASKRGRPTTPRSKIQSVEVIQDEGNIKTIKLYHEFDRYIVSCADKGPKGYKICGFNKFGDDIKSVGIDIGWKLVKIDEKDMSRSFYQMIKNNVGVAFKKSNKKGYVVTLAAP